MIKTLSSKTVYKNKWMEVVEDEVQFEDKTKGMYGVVKKSHFALIIPIVDDKLVLIKQYRYPVKEYFWEFPQGSYEDDGDIDPEMLARNELREETGYSAKEIKEIGFFYEAYGFTNQGFHIFLATNLTEGKQNLEAMEQGLEVVTFTVKEFEAMVIRGEVKDAPSISAFGLLKIKGLD